MEIEKERGSPSRPRPLRLDGGFELTYGHARQSTSRMKSAAACPRAMARCWSSRGAGRGAQTLATFTEHRARPRNRARLNKSTARRNPEA